MLLGQPEAAAFWIFLFWVQMPNWVHLGNVGVPPCHSHAGCCCWCCLQQQHNVPDPRSWPPTTVNLPGWLLELVVVYLCPLKQGVISYGELPFVPESLEKFRGKWTRLFACGYTSLPLHLRVVNLFHRCKLMGGARALLLESEPIFPISGGFPYLDSVVGHCLLLYCKIRAWALQAMESQNWSYLAFTFANAALPAHLFP